MAKAKDENLEEEWRLFIEHPFGAGTDKPLPDWIPYLPKPGNFKHPAYGEISFDVARNTSFVDNFKAGVYQTRIPIDAEHQTKISGAMGWITDMRMNANGSADAQVEWTDRGNKMMQGGRFRYVSPEFYPTWTDPATDKVFTNVAVGLAITNHPYFKESHLRPLVATEDGFFAIDEDRSDETTTVFFSIQESEEVMGKEAVIEKVEVPEVAEVTGQAFSEMQLKFAELQVTLAEEAEKRKEAEAKSQQLTEVIDKSNERIAKMEKVAQTKRFTELVEDGNRWYGETDAHLRILNSMAEMYGEDSDEFTEYTRQQTAVANQMSKSELFKEMGHSRSGAKTAADELEAIAKTIRSAAPTLSYAQAYSEALNRNPDLYDQHVKGN